MHAFDIRNFADTHDILDIDPVDDDWIVYNFHDINNSQLQHFTKFLDVLKDMSDNNEIVIRSIDSVVHGRYKSIPQEFQNTYPTPIPDPQKELKVIIGTGCLGALIIVIFYVIITTQIKRRTKYRPCC